MNDWAVEKCFCCGRVMECYISPNSYKPRCVECRRSCSSQANKCRLTTTKLSSDTTKKG